MIKTVSRIAIHYGLISVVYGLLKLYLCLVRVRSEREERILDHVRKGGGGIVALWHQRILLVLRYAERFGHLRPAVMISQSRDGDLIAGLVRRFHFRPVRGSSSKGGREALARMIAELSAHPFAVHVLDGPQGPRGLVKAGLVRMSQSSGAPIIPIYVSVNRAWVLRSWDRFLIPKPFSTVRIRWDEPISVPAELDAAAFERIRIEIEQRMRDHQERDDRENGWDRTLF